MNTVLPKIKLGSHIRIPLEQIKGSEKERFAYSTQLTHDLFQKVSELFVTNEMDSYTTKTTAVSARIIEEKIQEVLPQKSYIIIENLMNTDKATSDTYGTIFTTHNENEGVYTITQKGIKMPLTKDGKICADNVWVLLHEFTHIMDYIINPKIEIREFKTNLDTTFPDDLFHKYINTSNKNLNFFNRIILNLKLNKHMRNFSDEQKIDILQDIRYVIKSEINAYSNMLKYQAEIDKNLGINQNLKTDEQRLSEFDFDHKLKFINKKLSRTLVKTRKKHVKNTQKNKYIKEKQIYF